MEGLAAHVANGREFPQQVQNPVVRFTALQKQNKCV